MGGEHYQYAEKGVYFKNSNYDQLKKVYSIWICYKSTENSNTVTRFRMTKEDMVGVTRIDQRQYDLLQMVMIRLGDPNDAKIGTILHMLDTIFSDDEELSDKKKTLESDYGLKMTEPLSEEMNIMCNVSQGIKEKALNKGIEIGMGRGRAAGRDDEAKEAVLRMGKMDLPIATISAIAGRSEQIVSEWLKSADLPLN